LILCLVSNADYKICIQKNRNVRDSVAFNCDSSNGNSSLNLVSPVFAGGDHHDHGGKKCKDNGDNNCNDTHKTQKIKAKNECEIENENKDHSHDNQNINSLECTNQGQNLNDVEQTIVFLSNDTG
ncbi:MAG: hypothetical protein WBQ16_12015, partial [Nitrososphaeraceae archaeon]